MRCPDRPPERTVAGLQEKEVPNVTDRSTDLGNDDIRIHFTFHFIDAPFDLICDMRNDLNRFS